MRTFLSFVLLCLFVPLGESPAQSGGRVAFGDENRVVTRIPPPPGRVADLDGAFALEGGSVDDISRDLVRLYEDYRYSIYLVVYSGLIGSDVSSRAADFRDHWMGPDDEGLVIVFDLGAKEMAYALSRRRGQSERELILSDYETLQALERVLPKPEHKLDEIETVRYVGTRLVAEFEEQLQLAGEPEPKTQPWFLGVFAIAATLVMLLVLGSHRRGDQLERRRERVSFPIHSASSRLGAKFGGGVTGEISFRESDRND